MPARDQEYLEELSDGLHSLLISEEFTDVEFLVGEERFHAHRVVLCAASSFFRKLLTGKFQEGADALEAIPMDMCTSETFRMILDYLYRGSVTSISRSNAADLLRAADQLCIDRLVSYALNFLQDENIENSNVWDLLQLADSIGSLSVLRDSCVQFIAGNLSDFLSHSPNPLCGLSEACVYSTVAAALSLTQKTFENAAAHSHSLCQLCQAVCSWANDAWEQPGCLDSSHSAASVYKKLAGRRYSDIPVPAVAFSFTISETSSDSDGKTKQWDSDEFEAGGFSWSLHVNRSSEWYVAYLVPQSLSDALHGQCFAAFSISIEDPKMADRQFECATCNMSHYGRAGWGRLNTFQIAVAEELGAGFVNEGTLIVSAAVKVDPILALCTAAAALEFNQDPVGILTTFPCELCTSVMLTSDLLGIKSEEELLRIFTELHQDVDAEKLPGMIEEFIPTLRLPNIPVKTLLDAAKSSTVLQGSANFKEVLQKHFKVGVTTASTCGQAAWTLNQWSLRGTEAQPVPANDIVSVEALVDWMLRPVRDSPEQSELRRQLEEAHAEIEALKRAATTQRNAQDGERDCSACGQQVPLNAFSGKQGRKRCFECFRESQKRDPA